ncbi:MAG: dihydropteroate synthase [Lentisphaeria bacterium]|nr:dihydropteroate synthase [Lentisphaeria bacterium]
MFSLTDFLKKFRHSAIMGIVNASGDSFSEGRNSAPESALERALTLLDNGADLLDIGGESTRPGAAAVSEQEEIDRVIPVLVQIKKLRPDTVCSIDTRHGAVAKAALENGADIINDVSMLRNAPEIAKLTAEHGAALVISHSRGTPNDMQSAENCTYMAPVSEIVAEELTSAKRFAVSSGLAPENILLDPGFGFAKTPEQCWELLRDIEHIAPAGEILAGVSRKSFLGKLTGENIPAARSSETLAAELFLASKKVAVIRTHDVRSLSRALQVVRKIQGA